jgi:hypothetical protein
MRFVPATHDCVQVLPVHAAALLSAPTAPHPEYSPSVSVTVAVLTTFRSAAHRLEYTVSSLN